MFLRMQKLIEQFLKGVEATVKRELYYWLGYYVSSGLYTIGIFQFLWQICDKKLTPTYRIRDSLLEPVPY